MHGFVASRKALHRLLAMRLFTTPSDVVDVHDDLATERLLAALARYWLDSPPLTCSLDGCSPPMCSTDDKGCLPAWERKEEAQCQAYFAYPEHFTTPNFGERARTSVSCGRNRTVLETPLLRHVGPPLRIARPLFAGLLPGPDGTALFGADAMARLEEEPPEARRVLIYLAGHRDSPVFDRWYRARLACRRRETSGWYAMRRSSSSTTTARFRPPGCSKAAPLQAAGALAHPHSREPWRAQGEEAGLPLRRDGVARVRGPHLVALRMGAAQPRRRLPDARVLCLLGGQADGRGERAPAGGHVR